MATDESPGRPTGPYVAPAEHFRSRLPHLVPLLSSYVVPHGRLQHVAQCADGVLDFTITALTDDEVDRPDPRRLQALAHVDQQLSFTTTQLDRRLTAVRSGRLIRLVAQADTGAVICNSVVAGRHVVGAILTADESVAGGHPRGRPQVDEADRALARLTRDLRRRISLPSLNPGAYDNLPDPQDEEPDDGSNLDDVEPTVVGDGEHELVAACRAALSPGDVHYLAYHRDRTMHFSVDILAHERLSDFFWSIDPATRRRFYQVLGGEFDVLAADLNRKVHRVLADPIIRVVLDVEEGAIYYFRLRPHEYLLGVTLRQERVDHADVRIDQLVSQILDATGR